jgi:hypothetical protein
VALTTLVQEQKTSDTCQRPSNGVSGNNLRRAAAQVRSSGVTCHIRSTGALERHYNGSDMAAGDAQRVWFPEMIARLRSQWHPGMSFDAIVELRDDLGVMLQQIRSERHIRSPVLRCPQCGHVGEGAEPRVSVRALILSLIRFGIGPAEQTHALEKGWAAYRKQNGLDLYGKPMASQPTEVTRCAHLQVRRSDSGGAT